MSELTINVHNKTRTMHSSIENLSNCIISYKDYKHYLKKTLIITVEPCPYVVVTLAPIYFNQEKDIQGWAAADPLHF